MNSNNILYCWQIDTTKREDTLKIVTDKVLDREQASITKKLKESKFVEFDYSYYASPIPATDSMFLLHDSIKNS